MNGECGLTCAVTSMVLAAVGGVALPVLGVRMIVPSLVDPTRGTRNYRGREVFGGLGLVWVFWLLGVAIFLTAATVLAASTGMLPLVVVGSGLDLAFLMVAGAFLFGLVDDAFGSHADKGFRGHLSALATGRLTTGGLKLIGIGVLSLFGGAQIALAENGAPVVRTVVHGVAVAAVLALASNAINLFDLRPGRALKAYAALVLAGIAGALVAAAVAAPGELTPARLVDLAVLSVFCAGPVVAVWPFDLGERGMLGDAGANAFGMLAGVVVVSVLPWVATVAVAGALLLLNLASERVSFSAVIERSRTFSAIDRLGRRDDIADDDSARRSATE